MLLGSVKKTALGGMVTVALTYDAARTARRFAQLLHGGGGSTQRSLRRFGKKLVFEKEEKD